MPIPLLVWMFILTTVVLFRFGNCLCSSAVPVRQSIDGLVRRLLLVCLLNVPASVSQDRICADNFTCCHTEIEVADQTFYLTQLQYADTGPTSPSADPITPGVWQGSHWSANF